MPDLTPLETDLLGTSADGLTELLSAVRDGHVSTEEARELLITAVSQLIDTVVPTGPLDTYDDGIIRAGVAQAYDWLASLLRRDPVEIRARADVAEAEGRLERAKRLREVADRVSTRQEASA